jgi:endoglucanase
MQRKELLELARRLLTQPTAPYHEQSVAGTIEAICREHGIACQRDRVGNLIAKHEHRHTGAPIVLVAHMDHPGFEMTGPNEAEFLGGVPKEWFPGAPVRFYSGNAVVRGRVVAIDKKLWPKRKMTRLKLDGVAKSGDFGMWDVPVFRVAGDRLRATAIDDVLGTVVALATLIEVSRRRERTGLRCVFTRAEEVGFHGAMELCRDKTLPAKSLVVSIEMSKARPWAKMGDGPIVRVGDRATIFDGAGIYYLTEVAGELKKQNPSYRFQRCLMDGGACEATAFGAMGYRAAGVCLPLGNYHNIGPGRKIRAEYVSVSDLAGLVELTVGAARNWPRYEELTGSLVTRVRRIHREAPRKLKRFL